MPPNRGHDAILAEDVEEDDMPPLVDNPNPSLSYTFFSEMTPSFTSTPADTATQDVSPQASTSLLSSPPASPITPDEATPGFSMPVIQSRPHGKRRDPSYIPRPPNAFILFRSAFIREQNVPGKVEGNHSKLSKIIGLCWKQLTPEEREKWEAQAVVAQAEHRARYPDWRFRPGANAMAKLKVNEGGTSTARRRSVRSRTKDPPEEEEEDDSVAVAVDIKGKAREKGKGKAKSSRTLSLEETRCAKIAGFVAEGIKGEELEVAVKQWEGDRKMPRPAAKPTRSRGSKSQAASSSSSHSRSQSDASLPGPLPPSSKPTPNDSSTESTPTHTQSSLTPTLDTNKPGASESNNNNNSSHPTVTLSEIPLTHMFKRSLSVPAPTRRSSKRHHPPSEPSDDSSAEDLSPTSVEPRPGTWGTFKPLILPEAPIRTHTSPHARRDTISFPMPSTSATATFDTPHLTWQEEENRRRMEETQTPDSWWSQRSPPVEAQYVFDDESQPGRDRRRSVSFSTEDMGYEAQQGGEQSNRGYMEQYRSYEPAQDGSQHVEWTDLSSAGGDRQGLVTVIEDPYKDDCNNNSPSSAVSPPTLSLPPLSNSSYYYSPISPMTPSTVPSSSFSTLTGWAGDYKQQQTSNMRSWPDNAPNTLPPSPSAAPAGWYNNQGVFNWGDDQPQVQHSNISVDPHDWDRHEYRASRDMRLRVDPPPRQLNFDDELRRLHRGP